MAARKQLVKDRSHLANVLAKIEGGKSEIKIGDMRQALRLLKKVEVAGFAIGAKSIFKMLREEAVVEGKALVAKRKKARSKSRK